MAKGKTIVFRCEGGPGIGNGHVMRCLALADALAEDGAVCYFACDEETVGAIPALHESQHTLLSPSPLPSHFTKQIDLLVVDHYGLDATYETTCRPWAKQILVMDDLADRTHDCDFLLDQGLNRKKEDYQRLTPSHCQFLLGKAYWLLRKEFFDWKRIKSEKKIATHTIPKAFQELGRSLSGERAERSQTYVSTRNPEKRRTQLLKGEGYKQQKVLIVMGGTDGKQLLPTLIDIFKNDFLNVTLDIAVGNQATTLPQIKAMADNSNSRITLHIDSPYMAKLMAMSDMAISAAGTTALELAAMELPAMLIVVAGNQESNAHALGASGVAEILTVAMLQDKTLMADKIRHFISTLQQKEKLLADTVGTKRVSLHLFPEYDKGGRQVTLRPFEEGDQDSIYHWQKEPTTRKFFINPQVPTPDEHGKWFETRKNKEPFLSNIICCEQKPVGMVYLDPYKDGYKLSLLLTTSERGKGIGAAALRSIKRLTGNSILYADIAVENRASYALFQQQEFVPAEEKDSTYITVKYGRK